jgi:FG-GAP repeat
VGGPDDQFWIQGGHGLQDQPEAGDTFGFSLEASDFNGDLFPDLAVGAIGEDLEVDGVNDAGSVSVLYSTSLGLQADLPDDQFWTQNSPGMSDQAKNGNQFGWSLGASTP